MSLRNTNLDIWENIFKNNEWGKYPAIAVIKFIARNFYKYEHRSNVKILEIGSGPGANLWYMAREGFSVYGIDGSDTGCKQAISRLTSDHLDGMIGEVKAGDYLDKLNDFPDEYFDAIIDCESLYCNSFKKSREVIVRSFKKLKPEGRMLSITFADGTYGIDGEEIGYHAVIPINGPMSGKGYTRYTTRDDIERLYHLNCNSVVSVERQDLHLHKGNIIKEWIIEVWKN